MRLQLNHAALGFQPATLIEKDGRQDACTTILEPIRKCSKCRQAAQADALQYNEQGNECFAPPGKLSLR
jgi:hypothetical protein